MGRGRAHGAPDGHETFLTTLYMSGTTLFTLGIGDVVPHSPAGRFLTVFESGIGLGFLALVIGYLPVVSQAFSRREASIALLDARAGSPPTAPSCCAGMSATDGATTLVELLRDWERWSAELLESHVSFPVLAFYRSQHDNQSWVAAMTCVLDSCALVLSVVGHGVPASGAADLRHGAPRRRRHVPGPRPQAAAMPEPDRLPADGSLGCAPPSRPRDPARRLPRRPRRS